MATLPLVRYPLDPTGTNPDNLVLGEVHAVVRRVVRVCAPTYGGFYTESVVVRDLSNNQILTKGVQYYPAELYEVPSAKFGKEVCAILVITDQSVGDNISIDYQAVGGEFSTAADIVVQQILALENDNRPVAWGDVIAKPSEYPPSHHLHDLGDVYGFEYLVHAVDRLRAAILLGDDYAHDTIYQYIDSLIANYQAQIATTNGNLQSHLTDFTNPHRVTADQVDTFTKLTISQMVQAVQDALTGHEGDFTNPHHVTATQLGVYLTSQTYTRTETQTAITNAISPVQANLQNQINELITELQAHVGNIANPHQVYPGQIGTYTSGQIDAKLAASGGDFTNWTQFAINSGWSWVAPAKGMIHIWTIDESRSTTNLYRNGNVVSQNTKNGGAGYGRRHHDTAVFAAGDTLSWTSTDSFQGNVSVYYM